MTPSADMPCATRSGARAALAGSDRDAALLAGRVWGDGDGRQPPAVGHRPDRAGRNARVQRSRARAVP
jgi:hypothetical protein